MRTLYRAASVLVPPTVPPGEDGPAPTALIVQDGMIAWVGRAQDAPAAGTVEAEVDLGPALIVPGFVDAHAHMTETGLALSGLDLGRTRTVTELLDLVADAVHETPGGTVLGHGWDEAHLAEGRPPTRQELDRAGQGAPVYLSRVDVHSAIISTSLARLSGADAQDGWSPDGRVERAAHHAARRATRTGLDPARRRSAQLAALRAAAAAGIVAVQEMSVEDIASENDLRDLLALAADPEHPLPQVIAYRGELVADAAQAREVLDRLGVPVAGLAGDLTVDGSLGSRTAALREDYTDAPGQRGHLYLSVDQVRDHVAACTRVGVQAGFHVIGDAAIDVARRGLRRAAERVGLAAVRASRHRLEHVELLDAEAIADLADLGVTASLQPAFDAAWGGPHGMYVDRLGPDRAAQLNPFAALQAAGVPVAFGSDSPVTPFDPWGTLRAAVSHRTPRHRIEADAALAAHTTGAWRAAGIDGVGTLTVGAPASFAAWQPQTPIPAALASAAVLAALGQDDGPGPTCLLTVARGRVLFDAR